MCGARSTPKLSCLAFCFFFSSLATVVGYHGGGQTARKRHYAAPKSQPSRTFSRTFLKGFLHGLVRQYASDNPIISTKKKTKRRPTHRTTLAPNASPDRTPRACSYQPTFFIFFSVLTLGFPPAVAPFAIFCALALGFLPTGAFVFPYGRM